MKMLADIQMVKLPCHARADGELVVMESGKQLPFAVMRVFTVRAIAGVVRGQHAHKRCAQFLVSVQGAITVTCDDGARQEDYILDRGGNGLLVPPSIWAAETYGTDDAILMVLCDRPYEEDDYIRDHAQFLRWRNTP